MMKRSTVYLLFLTLMAAFWSAALAQETNRAALVVVLDGGEVVTRCVEFSEAQISGFELLNRSGLAVEAGGSNLGASVCRIEETGCPANNCFCQCAGGDCEYWSYWHLLDGNWRYSQIGAGAYQVGDGAVEGWSWGSSSPDEAPEPPLLTFDEVCAEQEPDKAAVAATTAPPAAPSGDGAAAGQWLAYGLLGLIVVGLAAALLAAQRRSSR